MRAISTACYFFVKFFLNKKANGKKNIKNKHFLFLLFMDCLVAHPQFSNLKVENSLIT